MSPSEDCTWQVRSPTVSQVMGCPELPAKRCEQERMLCRSALLLWVLKVLPLSMMSSMTEVGVRAGKKAWGAGFLPREDERDGGVGTLRVG